MGFRDVFTEELLGGRTLGKRPSDHMNRSRKDKLSRGAFVYAKAPRFFLPEGLAPGEWGDQGFSLPDNTNPIFL